MINPGIVIGSRYEIICEIGRGGMAKVYKAKDIRLDRNVAIKVLNPEYSDDKKFITKFIEEARAAASISHQNIVNVYDVGQEGGLYYIVMELVDGITLKQYIDEVGMVVPEDAIKISIQIAYGIEAAHNNNIIHRDIKPQNIVISDDGYAKVSDFGIAKVANGNTINNAVSGSVHYMAPEQARTGYTDEKSDIYSLGITMYEMVTGRLPFDTDNNASIVWSHLNTPIIPPSEYVEDIPYPLEQIILKATSKHSVERYSNISEVINDLKHALKNPYEPLPYSDNYSIMNDDIYHELNDDNKNIYYNDEKLIEDDVQQKDGKGEVVNPKIKKIMNIMTIVGGAIIALILIFVIAKLGFSSHDNSSDKVPKIVGMDINDAKKMADTSKFQIEIVEFDKEALMEDKDKIMKQTPEFGDKWPDANKKVIKVVVGGNNEVRVPELTDRPKDEAIAELEKLGISVKVEEAFDNDKEPGIVINTNPIAGSHISKSEKIILYVSKGPETITVPNLVDLDKAEAEKRLKDAGLKYSFETTNGTENKVIFTNPKTGTKISKSDNIIVYIGNGKKTFDLPDVTNKTLNEAIAELGKLKLKLEYVEENDSSVKAGNVIKTEPAAGEKVAEDSVVKVFVSNTNLTVPNVVGKKRDDAINILKGAGFEVGIKTDKVIGVDNDTVINQSIAPGESASKGTKITLTVNSN